MANLAKYKVKNGSTRWVTIQPEGYKSDNEFDELTLVDVYPFTLEDIIKFATTQGKFETLQRKWGAVRVFTINDLSINVGHINAKGSVEKAGYESSDGRRGGSEGFNTVNYIQGDDVVWTKTENLEKIINEYKKTVMKKVLWFSRHEMTAEQHQSLANKVGEIEVTQLNGTAANLHVPFMAEVNDKEATEVKPLKEWVKEFDIIAVVAPIGLLQQIVSVAGDKPVIQALNSRVRTGEGENFTFVFEKWERVRKVEIIKEDF